MPSMFDERPILPIVGCQGDSAEQPGLIGHGSLVDSICKRRIEDLYLVQRDADFLHKALCVMAQVEWDEWHNIKVAEWSAEDAEEERQQAVADTVLLDDQESDPILEGWLHREEQAQRAATVDMRAKVKEEKQRELQCKVFNAYTSWKESAEMQAWSGKRLRRLGEEKVLEERHLWCPGNLYLGHPLFDM